MIVRKMNYCPSQDWERNVEMEHDPILELLEEALYTDGGHHKQWCLIQIAKALGYTDLEWDEIDEGIPP